ncbi:unnamed protein product [Polarella glacialis]|uniref:V-type proton ATPase proteolipid subunit n=1 Tax=Polarella glacialis TaxID=89957 RepID=A0A813F2C6_POLGL|nr:unnamed protein product [Polarella glacialis]
MGVTSAIVFANMGAAYGTAKSGVGISSMGVMRPDMVMRSIIPVVMAGVLGIYGLITAAPTLARSQVRTEAKNDIDAKRASLSAPWGLQELDPGGDGDCGYRAIGVAYGLSNGETVEKVITEAKKLGATLRAKATAWLHQKKSSRTLLQLTTCGRQEQKMALSLHPTRNG